MRERGRSRKELSVQHHKPRLLSVQHQKVGIQKALRFFPTRKNGAVILHRLRKKTLDSYHVYWEFRARLLLRA